MLMFLLLGLVQGVTEFLPISSSGHLAIAEQLLKVEKPGIVFDIIVHFATLLAVVFVFRQRLGRMLVSLFRPDENLRLIWLLVLGSIPTGIMGLAFESWATIAFGLLWAVGLGLLATALALFAAERASKAASQAVGLHQVQWVNAIWIGLAQGIAVFPGVSRSGLTIAAGLWQRLGREAAAEFSFLLAIPAISAATALQLQEAFSEPAAHAMLWDDYLAGALVAFISGILSIKVLLRILQRGRLLPFAYYCAGLGALALLWSLWVR